MTNSTAAKIVNQLRRGTLDLTTLPDRLLDELQGWATSWASAPDGSRRLLLPIGGIRRSGTPILAAEFEAIRTAAMNENNRRCWE